MIERYDDDLWEARWGDDEPEQEPDPDTGPGSYEDIQQKILDGVIDSTVNTYGINDPREDVK